jgi:N-acetylmuramoyl-L-alanine amidase
MIALCVGHSRQGDSGAASVDGVVEYDYNCDLAYLISKKIRQETRIYNSYEGKGYTSSMRWLAKKLKEDGAKFAVELHFNAANPSATGHEWLYWHSSRKGRLLARSLRDSMEDTFTDFTSRGIKARGKGSRGAAFLRLTHCPAVIAEPFFGTNEMDWDLATAHKDGLAHTIAGGLVLYDELASQW